MYSSIATVCLSGSLEEKVDAIAEAGFEGIELFENDLTAFTGTPREAGELIRSRGLKLVTLQPFRDFEGLQGRAREQAFYRAEQKFDLMEELGTDLLMTCSTTHPDSLPGLSRAADDFCELGERIGLMVSAVEFIGSRGGRTSASTGMPMWLYQSSMALGGGLLSISALVMGAMRFHPPTNEEARS